VTLSVDLPLVIEVVEPREHLDWLLTEVDRMSQGGPVPMEKVRVLTCEESGRRN
jgi:PII-like signaling protein